MSHTPAESLNIVFTAKNEVAVRSEPIGPPGPGEVLLSARKTLISTGTEGIALSRLFDPDTHWDQWVKYPFHPGYSFAGEVIAVGKGVGNAKVGDRAATAAVHSQYVVAQAALIHPIPEGVSDEDATWFALANIVQQAVRRAEHALGDCVAVVGMGALGQLVVQYVQLLGARDIIAIDTAPLRLEMARAHGATHAVAAGVDSARQQLLALTDGLGANVVYDVTGNAAVMAPALGLLRRFGKLILLGDTGTPGGQHLTSDVITKGLSIIGSHGLNSPALSTDHAYWSHAQMTPLFFKYLARGDMRVGDLVTHRYAPADAPAAYRMLRQQRASAMGVVFDWTAL